VGSFERWEVVQEEVLREDEELLGLEAQLYVCSITKYLFQKK